MTMTRISHVGVEPTITATHVTTTAPVNELHTSSQRKAGVTDIVALDTSQGSMTSIRLSPRHRSNVTFRIAYVPRTWSPPTRATATVSKKFVTATTPWSAIEVNQRGIT